MTLSSPERSALLAVLHGAMDDDGGDDPEYTAALASLRAAASASTPSLPRIVGVREAAATMGISPSAFKERRRRGQIPEPDATLACGPIWLHARIAALVLNEVPWTLRADSGVEEA